LLAAVISLIVMLSPVRSLTVLMLATATLGLSLASVFPIGLSFVRTRMSLTGRVTGLFVVGASSGATLLPLLTGQLLVPLGPSSIIVIPLVAVTLALAIFVGILNLPSRH